MGNKIIAPALSLAWLTTCASMPTYAQESRAGIESNQDIVVTARRREETLLDVPSSVASIGAAQLEQSGANKLSDVEFAVPNVYFGNPNNRSQTAITIRGVGDFSRNIGMDTRVSVYVDGVFVGKSLATNQQLLEIERVEVLRGPQGTLFGKNTVAGAINLITRKPGPDFGGWGEGEVGNFGLVSLSGSVNLPISEAAKLKLGGTYRKTDGYVRNLFLNKIVGGDEVKAFRGALRLEPSDFVTLDFAADYSDADYESFQNATRDLVAFGGSPGFSTAPGNYVVNQDSPMFNKVRQWGASSSTTIEVGDGAIVAIGSYRDVRANTQNDEDAGPRFVANSHFRTRAKQATGEIRYESPPEQPFRFVVGAYISRETARSYIDAISPVLASAIPGNVLVLDNGRSKQTNTAVFANVEYDIVDQLTLELGARLLHDSKNIDFTQLSTNPALGLASFTTRDSFGDTAFTPSGSLKYKFSSNTQIYVRASRGYKSGGFNADVVADPNIRFQPETVEAVEGGIKAELFDRKISLGAAVFSSWHADYQVFQFITPAGGNSSVLQLRNAGKARSQGFELEFGARLSRLSLGAGVGYADAKFLSFPACTRTSNCDGQRLAGSPKWTASANAQYQVPLDDDWTGSLFVQYSYRDATFTDVPNVPDKATEAISLVNARLSLKPVDAKGIEFFLHVDNLFDVEKKQSGGSLFLGIPTAFYTMPRTYGGGVRVTF